MVLSSTEASGHRRSEHGEQVARQVLLEFPCDGHGQFPLVALVRFAGGQGLIVFEEIQWHKDAAQAIVRIKMPSGIIPFFGFLDLKKNKEGWKVDNTNYGFIEHWEDIK